VDYIGVRQTREKLGMSREALAARAGVSSVCLWGFEAGRTKPQVATLRVILSALSAEVKRQSSEEKT